MDPEALALLAREDMRAGLRRALHHRRPGLVQVVVNGNVTEVRLDFETGKAMVADVLDSTCEVEVSLDDLAAYVA